MPVMNNEGQIFDERRKVIRRKADNERRKADREIILDRRQPDSDRRVNGERRKKNINA